MFQLKKKIINYILIKGNKHLSEKLLKNSFKKFNRNSKKNSRELIQFFINYSSFVFKLKTRPTFFLKTRARTSFSIKFIKKYLLSNKVDNFEGLLVKKREIQKKIVASKRLLLFYRWTNDIPGKI